VFINSFLMSEMAVSLLRSSVVFKSSLSDDAENEVLSPEVRWFVEPHLEREGSTPWISPPKKGDAGFDIRSAEDLLLSPHTTVLVSTGISVAIAAGFVGLIKDRSSMAMQSIMTSGGVIDSNYRGELKIIITNMGVLPFEIVKGDRIAQLLVIPCLVQGSSVKTLEALGTSDRGQKGFGSSGK
jgi:dUTP pyrophosphatase